MDSSCTRQLAYNLSMRIQFLKMMIWKDKRKQKQNGTLAMSGLCFVLFMLKFTKFAGSDSQIFIFSEYATVH